jgi:hypothetical protein
MIPYFSCTLVILSGIWELHVIFDIHHWRCAWILFGERVAAACWEYSPRRELADEAVRKDISSRLRRPSYVKSLFSWLAVSELS